jgi:hypothetical protein
MLMNPFVGLAALDSAEVGPDGVENLFVYKRGKLFTGQFYATRLRSRGEAVAGMSSLQERQARATQLVLHCSSAREVRTSAAPTHLIGLGDPIGVCWARRLQSPCRTATASSSLATVSIEFGQRAGGGRRIRPDLTGRRCSCHR